MKKTLTLLAALAVLLSLAGCGGNGEDLEEKITGAFDSIEKGFDSIEDGMDKLDDKINGREEPTATPEPTSEPTEEPAADQATEPAAEAAPSDDTIRPEIKEAIDSYEEFFNEYADFMASYDASDISALTGYLSMLEQYTDTMQKLEDMEDADLTTAELNYYTQAMLRIDQVLLEAAS